MNENNLMERKLKFIAVITFILLICATFQNKAQAQNIRISGTISNNAIWFADTVKITGNVTIQPNVKVVVPLGSYIEFQGHYSITVNGCFQAIGTNEKPVIFTIKDTTGFHDINIISGGWMGLRFENDAQLKDSSQLRYCVFSYGKANNLTHETRSGAAVYANRYSKLSITYCRFKNNLAVHDGAAIYCNTKSSPAIHFNLFENNLALESGGAITCKFESSPTISNNVFIGNRAGLFGGAIYCDSLSSPQINSNQFDHNQAVANGGAIACMVQSNASIERNTITYNTADLGGGIYAEGFDSNVYINANYVFNNQAYNGGGVFDGCFFLRLVNNVICNNEAVIGGGVYNGFTFSMGVYANNTISNNKSYKAAGVMINSPNMQLVNDVIYGNVATRSDTAQIGIQTAIPVVNYCLVQGGFTGENNIDANPQFRLPTAGAGIEFDALNADWKPSDLSSACMDNGSPDTTGLYLGKTDITGNPRLDKMFYRIDIGAFEDHSMATQIDQPDQTQTLIIYPNPTTGVLYIEFTPLNYEACHLSIQTLDGRTLTQKHYPKTQNLSDTFDLSQFAKGVYLVKVVAGNTVIIKRIVKS